MANDALGIIESERTQVGGGYRFSHTQIMILGTGNNPNSDYFGFVVQNVRVQYQQPVTRLRGMNTRFVYMVASPPEGTLTLGTIIGDAKGTQKFVDRFADPCKVDENILTFMGPAGCESNKYGVSNESGKFIGGSVPQTYEAEGCLIESLEFTMDIQNLLLSVNTNMKFIRMTLASTTGSTPAAAPASGGAGGSDDDGSGGTGGMTA
jgi:hypothetical protein